jgi:hypothetical protein
MFMTYEELKPRLGRSKFRSRFKLTDKDRSYIANKGWNAIEAQIRKIINQRLATAFPENDGQQTPMRNHPIFIAQHATATCCRSCLNKWHRITPGRALTEKDIDYIAGIILGWLHDKAGDLSDFPQTQDLFDNEDE